MGSEGLLLPPFCQGACGSLRPWSQSVSGGRALMAAWQGKGGRARWCQSRSRAGGWG